MKITIYELLGLIKDGKAPKKIKVNKIIFEYQGDDYLYKDEDKKEYWLFSAGYTDKFEWLDSALNTEVEILDGEDEFIDIEEITINGEKLGYGGLSEWLSPKQTDNEAKLCSSIECLGVTLNDLIKNQKKIINKLNLRDF